MIGKCWLLSYFCLIFIRLNIVRWIIHGNASCRFWGHGIFLNGRLGFYNLAIMIIYGFIANMKQLEEIISSLVTFILFLIQYNSILGIILWAAIYCLHFITKPKIWLFYFVKVPAIILWAIETSNEEILGQSHFDVLLLIYGVCFLIIHIIHYFITIFKIHLWY